MSQVQPFIWKSSLGGPIVAWGRVSGDLQGRSNSVSQVDGVSDMALPASSVILSAFLSGRKLSPSCGLDATSHFSSSLYATGAFQAATLVLELRGSESE